jgi:hypothetical protein
MQGAALSLAAASFPTYYKTWIEQMVPEKLATSHAAGWWLIHT